MVQNPHGSHPVVVICEHASNRIPEQFENLGLNKAVLESHIAWDPGALLTAESLSRQLDAVLVQSTISRLIYDCNRPPHAASAMPERSEATPIPGNQGLDKNQREIRVETYYRPFEAMISEVLDQHEGDAVVVTIHSFTPQYLGKKRDVEIGILHDQDKRLADAILDIAGDNLIVRNEPYGPKDGVTHTLQHHALPRGLLNVMIEIRNDLIASPEQCAAMAGKLGAWLSTAIENLSNDRSKAAAR